MHVPVVEVIVPLVKCGSVDDFGFRQGSLEEFERLPTRRVVVTVELNRFGIQLLELGESFVTQRHRIQYDDRGVGRSGPYYERSEEVEKALKDKDMLGVAFDDGDVLATQRALETLAADLIAAATIGKGEAKVAVVATEIVSFVDEAIDRVGIDAARAKIGKKRFGLHWSDAG